LGWLITWLLLALLGGLAVFTRRGRRQPADETLIAELLGPSQPPAARVLPAPQPREEDESPAARVPPAPQPHDEDEPPPATATLPTGEGGWLETQLASITAWSERMHKQIAASQAGPDPRRCCATTTKGSQCKLPAEPSGTKCAIHGAGAHLRARVSAPGGARRDSCQEVDAGQDDRLAVWDEGEPATAAPAEHSVPQVTPGR
jgi:hypothetical protein